MMINHCREKIGEYAKKSILKKLILNPDSSCQQFQTAEKEKQWVQSLMVGGNILISSLECCQVHYLYMHISLNNNNYYYVVSSLRETVAKVNSIRKKKKLPSLELDSGRRVANPFVGVQ